MTQSGVTGLKPRIGVVADDLTGAAELAGVAWRFGFTAEVQTEIVVPANADVVAMDTDSRGSCDDEAARRVSAATQRLKSLGVEWIYKKMDSVLRGPVLAEVSAALSVLRLKRALVVPVNPGLGRVIRDGNYFIRGKPIHETDFRHDPQHPRISSRILDMLGPARSTEVSVCRFDDALPITGIVVGEAGTEGHLRAWAGRLDESILPVGGGAFFAAILEKQRQSTLHSQPAAPAMKAGPTIFVCGSMSASAREFLQRSRERRWPVLAMPTDLVYQAGDAKTLVHSWASEAITTLGRHPRIVVAIDKPLMREKATRFTELLVAAIAAVMRRAPVARVNVEGGATAAALMRAQGWTRLRVVREESAGVVAMRPEGKSGVVLTIKPGSYPWAGSMEHVAPGL